MLLYLDVPNRTTDIIIPLYLYNDRIIVCFLSFRWSYRNAIWDHEIIILNIQVQIGNYRDVVDLMSKIDSLPRPAGGTNIHEALEKMRDMYNVDHRFDGKRYKRFIAIVITDGGDRQTALVQSTASAAHADGIVVIAIGKVVSACVD